MEQNKAIELSINLMNKSEACYLTTINTDGFPKTRAMLNLRNTDKYPDLKDFFKNLNKNFIIYFTTNQSSDKIKEIKSNPRISVYYCIPNEWKGLMIGGNIEIIKDKEIKSSLWQKDWTLYYPNGIDDTDYAVLKLNPLILKLYYQLDSYTLNF